MHAHFAELRAAMPMNLVKRWPIKDGIPSNAKLIGRPGVEAQLARVQQIEAPSVVSKATSASSSSSGRNRVRTIIIGAIIGLLLGIVVALIIGGSRRRGAATA